MERVQKPDRVWEDVILILKTPARGAAKARKPNKVPTEAPEVVAAAAAERVAEEAAGNNFMDQHTKERRQYHAWI